MDSGVCVYKNAFSGQTLCAVAGHCIPVIEMPMSNSVKADLTAIVYPGLLPKPSISGTRLDTAASNSGSCNRSNCPQHVSVWPVCTRGGHS